AAQDRRFKGSEEFVHGLSLLGESATVLGIARDRLRVQWFPTGFSIVEQGEFGASLYLILSGEAQVVQEEAAGTRHVLRQMAAGEFFGELSVAHGSPRSASVVAGEAVTCLVLSAEAPTTFVGRGAEARLTESPLAVAGTDRRPEAAICIDVGD